MAESETATGKKGATKPWATPWEEIAEELGTSLDEGLSQKQAKTRLEKYGPNRLKEAKKRSPWSIFVDQFVNPVVFLLVGAAALSAVFGKWVELIAILVVIIINVAIGFFTELRATRSLEALRQMTKVDAKVMRGARAETVPSEKLVPGDVVILESGDIVSADVRLTEASRMEADESSLTGESLPVKKGTDPVDKDTPLAERENMVFKGTFITGGSGHGIVVATGMDTEIGRVAELAEEAEGEVGPLEKRLDRLAHRLVWITLAIAALVAGVGLATGKDAFIVIETALALAVAAIPEGLPIVATLALAQGMWRLAEYNALVRGLSSVETLGSTGTIFTDKTGTLTENRLTFSRAAVCGEDGVEDVSLLGEDSSSLLEKKAGEMFEEHPALREILKAGALCNNAHLDEDDPLDTGEAIGDPLEVALLKAAYEAGMDPSELLDKYPEEKEVAFESDTKMMATYNRTDEGLLVSVKGAPGAVLDASSYMWTGGGAVELGDDLREKLEDANTRMAKDGLRVLAVAKKEVSETGEGPYSGLTFLGIIGLMDPPRSDVKDALSRCREAGIRVIMVTGDQPDTAAYIGKELLLADSEEPKVMRGKDIKPPDELSGEERDQMLDVDIFSRVSPEQKLDLIKLHQNAGSIVAMTGDGVNDTPALKKADIGVAMGGRGTQVARQAADLVLLDDAFATIVVAIEQGRAIFDNIRKFMVFLLSGNIGEIMIIAVAMAAGLPLPLLPLQILYLNIIGDVFPALALGLGKGDPENMTERPRDPDEPILTRGHWWAIGGYGALIAATVLAGFVFALYRLDLGREEAVSMAFLTLSFSRLWHVFNMRERVSGAVLNEVSRNPYVWGALAICIGLLVAAIYVPVLSDVLSVVPPGASGWGLILGMSVVPLVIGQAVKIALHRLG